MKIFKTIKHIIYNTCLYFTVAEFAVLIAAAMIGHIDAQSGGEIGTFLSLSSAGLILLACFLMSLLNLVWRLDYSMTLKVLIHFIGALASFALVFIVIPGIYANMAQVIVRLLLFAALYFIIAFVVLIVGSIRKNRRTEQLDYDAQFKNVK